MVFGSSMLPGTSTTTFIRLLIRNLGVEHFYAAFGLGVLSEPSDVLSPDLWHQRKWHQWRLFCSKWNCQAPETTDRWHSLRNSHPEQSENWPAGNRSTTLEDVKEESSQNCCDSEDSSGLQSASTVEAEDIESDLESLEGTLHYSTGECTRVGFWWWSRRHSKVSLAPYYVAPCKTYVPK